jgi:hypothetical protein
LPSGKDVLKKGRISKLADDSEIVGGRDSLENFEGLCHRVMGFIEGEGCLAISINISGSYVKVYPQFLVVQSRDDTMLKVLQEVLKCGKIYPRKGRGRQQDFYLYEVNNKKDVAQKLIPFFDRYGFIGKMKRQYPLWREAAIIACRKKHLTLEDMKRIFDLKKKLEEGRLKGKRRGQRVTWERIVKAFASRTSEHRSSKLRRALEVAGGDAQASGLVRSKVCLLTEFV